MPVAHVLCVLNELEFTVFQWIFTLLSAEQWKVETKQHCRVPRSLCNNTWWCNSCAGSAAFPECLDRAQNGGRHWGVMKWGWQEGCLGGSDLPSFHFSPPVQISFLYAFHFSCPASLPPSTLTTLSSIPLSFSNPHLPPTLIPSPFLLCRTSGQRWLRQWGRKGSRSWRSRGWGRYWACSLRSTPSTAASSLSWRNALISGKKHHRHYLYLCCGLLLCSTDDAQFSYNLIQWCILPCSHTYMKCWNYDRLMTWIPLWGYNNYSTLS